MHPKNVAMRRALLTGLLIVLLLLATAPIYFYRLGRSGLGDPDEGRNAEAGREILVTGDWVTPRLNEARYLDKPPAFFWTLAVSYGFFGVNEFAARLPSALFALAGIVLLGWFAARHAGWGAGLLSGLVLALTPLYMIFGRLVIFDMMLTFCMTVSALAAFEVLESAQAGRGAAAPVPVAGGRLVPALFFAAAGLGTITKGPVAFIIPLLTTLAWALLRGRTRLLGRLRWGTGGIIYAAIVVPWLALAAAANPGYLHYAIVGENLRRMSSNMFETARPFYFYVKVIVPGLFPWILYAVASAARRLPATAARLGATGEPRGPLAALRRVGGRLRQWRAGVVREGSPRRLIVLYAAVWLVVLIVFFSSIASKRPSYMLPCAVPLAILCGCLWAAAFRSGRRLDDVLRGEPGPGAAFEAGWRGEAVEARRDLGWGSGIAAVVCAAGAPGVLLAGPLSRVFGSGEGEYDPLLSRRVLFALTAMALLATAGLLHLLRRRPRPAASFAAAALSIAVMVPLGRAATGFIDAARSSRPVSEYLAGRLGRDDVLVCFEQYRPGLNFYLKRWLVLAKGQGTPFTSNYMKYHLEEFRRDPSFRMITYADLRLLLGDPSHRVFILAPRKEYQTLRTQAQGLLTAEPVWEDLGAGLFVRAGDTGR